MNKAAAVNQPYLPPSITNDEHNDDHKSDEEEKEDIDTSDTNRWAVRKRERNKKQYYT